MVMNGSLSSVSGMAATGQLSFAMKAIRSGHVLAFGWL